MFSIGSVRCNTIWKFPIKVMDFQTVEMPLGAQIISVQPQNGVLCMWALVDSEQNKKELRRLWVFGTGNPIEGSAYDAFHQGKMIHLATVKDGSFVWHVFESIQ